MKTVQNVWIRLNQHTAHKRHLMTGKCGEHVPIPGKSVPPPGWAFCMDSCCGCNPIGSPPTEEGARSGNYGYCCCYPLWGDVCLLQRIIWPFYDIVWMINLLFICFFPCFTKTRQWIDSTQNAQCPATHFAMREWKRLWRLAHNKQFGGRSERASNISNPFPLIL